MLDTLYFSLFVLAVSGVGVILQPTSAAAKFFLIANIAIVSMQSISIERNFESYKENPSKVCE